MIKFSIFVLYLNVIIVLSVMADDNSSIMELKDRLSKINSVYACFDQKIYNVDEEILEESKGNIWFKKPNMFFIHIKFPEESFLISNGQILWLYIPIVQQVIIYWSKDFFNQIYLMFFSNNNQCIIDDYYDINQQGDVFYLISKSNDFYFKQFEIKITNHGIIEQFGFINQSSQYISYFLSNQNNYHINDSKFYFNPPKDVHLDDQRK